MKGFQSSGKHECKHWKEYRTRRGFRICRQCGRREFLDGGKWRREMSLKHFSDKWLPAVSGTNPRTMMVIEVAFPFEWNCYESWNTVFKVKFDFSEAKLQTRLGVMDGYQSDWHEDLNLLDYTLEKEYKERTGNDYQIGDNTYEEMRRVIQSG
jgi:hypothetical protein